jgi:hypothetical protein
VLLLFNCVVLQFLASELDLARSVLIRTGLATLTTTQQTSSHTSTLAARADNALKPIRSTTNMINTTNTAQTGKVRFFVDHIKIWQLHITMTSMYIGLCVMPMCRC